IVLAVTAFYAVALHRRKAAYLFVGAAVIYAVGCFGLTIAVNVPMNEALAAVDIPHDMQEAQQIWSRYSDPWKNWNVIRTVASGASLMSTGLAMLQLNPGRS
ncbi:MAG: DUF1772 domain-containing protein, partial [Hyphomicrobiales bacterium]|nr:DUF1772 domain-containing protein [Hyphomicrobiales bacterium]